MAEVVVNSKIPLFIDVSHTYSSDLQTGMQKVVRQLCAAWSSGKFDCKLVVFQGNGYKVLPDSSFREILIPYSERIGNELQRRHLWRFIKPLYRRMLKLLPDRSRKSILTSRPAQKLQAYINSIPNLLTTDQVPDSKFNLLVLELVYNPDHLNYILDLSESGKANITFFSYDLIPINHSEYCPTEFCVLFRRYLQISKVSQRLWSISATTKLELDQFVGEKGGALESRYKWLPPSIFSKCDHPHPVLGQGGESDYWLFVSSFEPRKNHSGLFEALLHLKKEGIEVPAIVFVGGSSWNDDPISKGIDNLRKEGFNLIKLINIDECCVGNLYSYATLCLYPSHFEGFGLPVVESLSFGVPVITSDVGSTGELLNLPGTLGFNAEDNLDLAEKMKSFITDEDLRKSLFRTAQDNRHNLGNWSEYGKELFNYSMLE